MRNYSDPKMSIAMFDAENVVTDPSGLVGQAYNDYFSQNTGSHVGRFAENTVAVNNILNFTNVQ